ncbi:hypothetical protein DACRYDRAFT_23628 [Dacryopinax primogenitus]|uniref:Uncharacterized protein n=1 Tax=Dacryopinax primogenitus (strain DJM 731) TaxID=1858805 RepID=M5G6V9_DACPD|nr:uncharacterized protein DACRYDRAFT_23628 [Dacryopinax primogenitus]EJT99492.1 hypothetical protein DACRYDRAFT_23628 [Dacryopinax primogenitus]
MVSVKLFSLLALLASIALLNARVLTNGERLARGIAPAKPKRLYEPTRVHLSKRSATAGQTYVSSVGISTVPIPLRKRSTPVSPEELRRTAQELRKKATITKRDGAPFNLYIAGESGSPLYTPPVQTTTSAVDAVQLSYVFGGETTMSMSSTPNTYYISTCCPGQTGCFLDPQRNYAVVLHWTYVASPNGFYPGSVNPPGQSEEYCSDLESTIFSVDATTGEITIQYLNPTSSSFYPPGYSPLPEQAPETYVVLYGSEFYLTANYMLTAEVLGGGSLATLYVNPIQ